MLGFNSPGLVRVLFFRFKDICIRTWIRNNATNGICYYYLGCMDMGMIQYVYADIQNLKMHIWLQHGYKN